MTDRNTRPVVVTKDARGRAELRRVPFDPVKITATAVGGAQTIQTAQASQIYEVAGLTLSNGGASAIKVTLHTVASGDSAADANIAIHAVSVPANGVVDLSGLISLLPNASLQAWASATDDVRVSGWSLVHL